MHPTMSHHETNPYFFRPTQHQRGDSRGSRSRQGSGVSQQPRHHGENMPSGSMVTQTRHDEPSHEFTPGSGLVPEPREDQQSEPNLRRIELQEPKQDQHSKRQGRQKRGHQFPSRWVLPPHDQENRERYGHPFVVPKDERTRPITWFGAVFCAIFWIVIFLGGLIVLIVYLIYRPRNPRFDVSSVTLNAAYVDAGSMLNADLSMLVNFTNPNKKARVDFNTMIIDLYYGPTLMSTQYIEPFSAARTQSRFVNLHMITSQVSLSKGQIQQLQQQINKNGIIFDVRGAFRVRCNLGSFLRYSYRLYSHCRIEVTSPPNGVLRATRCRTKR